MAEFLTLTVNRDVPAGTMASLLSELGNDATVKSARRLQERALDPQSMKALVEVAGGVLTTLSSAWALVDKIRQSLHSRKIVGAHLTMPNGTHVDVDQIDEEQLGQLLGGQQTKTH